MNQLTSRQPEWWLGFHLLWVARGDDGRGRMTSDSDLVRLAVNTRVQTCPA